MIKRVIINIYGQVQGVFFRVETAEKASSLGLAGWVKNEDGGSVTVLAEGEESALQRLAEWCKTGGPAGATVERLETRWEEATGEFKEFNIIH